MVRSGRRDFKKKCGRLKCEVAVWKNLSTNVTPHPTFPTNVRGTRKRPPLPSPLLQRRRGRLLRVGAYYKQATPLEFQSPTGRRAINRSRLTEFAAVRGSKCEIHLGEISPRTSPLTRSSPHSAVVRSTMARQGAGERAPLRSSW